MSCDYSSLLWGVGGVTPVCVLAERGQPDGAVIALDGANGAPAAVIGLVKGR